jgi:hypothetical protein
MATSVPGADGDAEIGLGQGGCVVDPVADHGDLSAAGLQLGDLGGLVAGEDLGDDGADAELGGDARRGGLVVTGEHDDLDAEVVQRRDRRGGGFARCVGDADDRGGLAVDRGDDGGTAGGGQLVPAGGEVAEVDALAVGLPPVPDDHPVPVDLGDGAVASHVLELVRPRRVHAPGLGVADDRRRQGVFGLPLHGGDQPQ